MNISAEIIWLLAGIVLFFSEFFIPGLVIAFFGGGALVTALTSWLGITNSLGSQLLVFMITSVLMLVGLRKFLKKVFIGQLDDDEANRNFNIEVGKVVPVVEYIQPGEVGGKVRYQGAPWQAISAEAIAPGESVKIVGFDNLTLKVEKLNKEDK